MLIGSDHTQPGPMGLSQSHPKSQPEPWLECTPMASGMWTPSEVMWPSCDDHATMCHPGHLVSRPSSQKTWDLRVPTLSFQSISILLHTNASLIALQWLCAYLLSFPTWRLNVCTPVPCLHPHLVHP